MAEISVSDKLPPPAIGDAVEYTATGLVFNDDLTWDQYELLAATLERMESGVNWWIGDAACYGEHRWGDKYVQAWTVADELGRPVDSVRVYQWVADRIPFVTRVTNLSWTHHREIAACETLDERVHWLNVAAKDQLSSRQLRKAIRGDKDAAARQITLGDGSATDSGDRWKTYNDQFQNVLPNIEFDCIVTDPPYPVEFQQLWVDLAALASQQLPDQGMLIAMSGKIHLDWVMRTLSEHLNYGWMYAMHMSGSSTRVLARQIAQEWKPWLVYTKGTWPSGRIDWHPDHIEGSYEKDEYHWQQDVTSAQILIERLTPPNATIVDPMMGSGSFGIAAIQAGRRFIGIEADTDRYAASVDRIQASVF